MILVFLFLILYTLSEEAAEPLDLELQKAARCLI